MSAFLVEDVLDHIIQSCPISTLTVISRISSSLRRLALPHLVRTVYLDKSPKQVVGFLNFIIDNAAGSGPLPLDPGRYVFELELFETLAFRTHILHEGVYVIAANEQYRLSTWAPMLTRALTLMPNLRSFSAKGNTEDIVTHAPDFGHALLSLSKLTSLTLWGVSSQTSLSFCRAMDSATASNSLHELEIDGSDKNDENTTVLVDDGVGQFLSQNNHGLTELRLSALDLTDFLAKDGQDHFQGSPRVTFPYITKLTIGSCEISVEALASAFPALLTLNLGFSEFLRQYYTGAPQDHISFPSLISIEGRYKDIYAILKCNAARAHVRRVVVSYPWDKHDDDDDDDTPFAVPKIAPQLKSFHFIQKRIKPISWWQAFGKALPHLSHLRVLIYSSSTDDWDLICNHIPTAISSMPLDYLSVVVEEYERVTTDAAFFEESIALSFSKAIPTLQCIEVFKKNFNVKDRSTAPRETWWKIVRGSNDSNVLQMRQLGAEEGSGLRDQYDLQTNSTAKAI